MTHLLACLLCSGTAGVLAPAGSSTGAGLGLQLREPGLAELDRDLRVEAPRPPAFTDESPDGHPGHEGGAGMGPLWIMMGVMMVGMMVVAGAYMMRGHWAAPPGGAPVGSPRQGAIPPTAGARPGG